MRHRSTARPAERSPAGPPPDVEAGEARGDGSGGSSWGPVLLFFAANVIFGAGLYFHQLLYNFYLQDLGHGEAVMGLAAAALSTGGLLALVPAGAAVDRWGVRRTYVGAAVVAAAGLALGAVVERTVPVYLAAAVGGAGAAAFRVTMGPALLRLAGPDIRARAFSWNTASLVAAGAGWTAAAGALSDGLEPALGRLGGMRAAMLAGAVVTLAAALMAPLALRAVGASRPPAEGEGGSVPPDAGRSAAGDETADGGGVAAALRRLAIPRPLVAFIAAVGVFWAAGALALPFFNLWFEREHGLPLGSIGVVLGGAQLLTALAVFASGEGASRAGPGRMLTVWLLLFPPALAGLALSEALGPATAFYLVQAFVLPAVYPLVDQILLERVPEDRRGALSAWRNVATEGSGLVGAALGGWLLQVGSFATLFGVAGGTALAAAAVTIGLLRRMGIR